MRIHIIALLFFLPAVGAFAQVQPTASLSVRYLVTYEAASKKFTAWVVPDYDTPNANNPDTDERGTTAQFSLKVPGSFVMTQLQDIRGTWDKQPVKIEPQRHMPNQTDGSYGYYVIGKTPAEVSYGEFKQGEPVALFTFTGTGTDPNLVQALETTDPFINLADNVLSLNVRGSFYSRSGQDFRPTTRPVEQFVRTTTLKDVLKEAQQKVTAAQPKSEEPAGETVLIYPNPVQQVVTVTYLSEKEQGATTVEWIDMRGIVQQSKQTVAKQGVNTLQLQVGSSSGGMYFVRTTVNGKSTTSKINKL